MGINEQKFVDKYPKNTIKVPRFNEDEGFYTTPERSVLMSKIKSKETQPEKKLRNTLWHLGIRYRKNVKKLPGSPDILIGKYKLAIFIDGAFWHGHNWEEKKGKIKSNRSFWIPKIERNMQRDGENNEKLAQMGYTVMRFWDFEVKHEFVVCLNTILDYCEAYHENESC
jgi:DNA mismatch endonuclease, patch repair protein